MPVKATHPPAGGQKIQERIKKLTDQINDLRYRYHVLDDPSVTDQIYDSLTQELVGLEKDYPQFKLKNSPTNRVGGVALDKFEKVTHQRRMLLLSDALALKKFKPGKIDCEKFFQTNGGII